MIFNLEIYNKTGFTGEQFIALLMVKNKYYVEASTNPSMPFLEENGYLSFVKGKKDDNKYYLARLSKKAKDFIRDLSIPGISDEVKQVGARLIDLYMSRGYEQFVSNKRKTVELLAWYMSETDFSASEILSTVEFYLDNNSPPYISQSHNLIWKPANVFGTKPKLTESKLFQLQNKK